MTCPLRSSRSTCSDSTYPSSQAVPGLQRWVVNLAINGDDPAPYDAITEFWFADAAAFQAAMESPEVAAALKDGDSFVAPPGPTLMVADEHIVIDALG